jgi:uncharacterized RDD family membrane protein YckC
MNDEAQAVTPPTKDPNELAWQLRGAARYFDLMLAYLLLSCILFIISPDNSLPAINELEKNIWTKWLLLGPLVSGFLFVIDAIIYRLFGNTPGKALLGLRVHRSDNVKPSFSFYFKRNAYIWVYGFACNFFLLSVLANIYQQQRIEDGKKTTYDEKLNCSVAAQPINMSRMVLFGCLFTCLLIFTLIRSA